MTGEQCLGRPFLVLIVNRLVPRIFGEVVIGGGLPEHQLDVIGIDRRAAHVLTELCRGI